MSAPRLPRYGSTLSQQIQEEKEQERHDIETTPTKSRSFSDAPVPSLSPSPAFIENSPTTKDDSTLLGPITPRRPNFPVRGLSLQMPDKEVSGPLSPKLDQTQGFGSPVLPRRSRGLDFARACTNLHHSTLAEPSPDSSPTIANSTRSMHIPRKSMSSTSELTNNGSNRFWSMGGERNGLSGSVSSINILESDSNDSDSSDDDMMDRDVDDPVLNTPQVLKLSNNFNSAVSNSPGGEWMNNQYSPAAASLMNFQRARLGKHRSRNSSSSGHSSKQSPGPLSPPILKSVEGQNYFGSGLTKREIQSRRESLSLGTNKLHLDDSADEDQGKMNGSGNSSGDNRGVIRRAVTRPRNLLVRNSSRCNNGELTSLQPKTKHFARIRAELIEESAPIDSEAKREAQVVAQVRESEPTSRRPSPRLTPSSGPVETLESVLEDETTLQDAAMSEVTLTKSNSFSQQAERNSGGLRFWDKFDERYRTPPPQLLPTRSSSGMSMGEETASSTASNMDSGMWNKFDSRSRSSTPVANSNGNGAGNSMPTAVEFTRRVNNKRRRDDDFDPESFKRRAVSPGVSVHSSPIMSQSPVFDGKAWGRPPPKQNNGHNDRSNSGTNSNSAPKRVGLQEMSEANDSLSGMSIE